MKIQKKQAIGENLLYVMVWTAIILVPVLNSQMMSEMHVNLENVLTAWRYIAPYLIIFLIPMPSSPRATCSGENTGNTSRATWR